MSDLLSLFTAQSAAFLHSGAAVATASLLALWWIVVALMTLRSRRAA